VHSWTVTCTRSGRASLPHPNTARHQQGRKTCTAGQSPVPGLDGLHCPIPDTTRHQQGRKTCTAGQSPVPGLDGLHCPIPDTTRHQQDRKTCTAGQSPVPGLDGGTDVELLVRHGVCVHVLSCSHAACFSSCLVIVLQQTVRCPGCGLLCQ